MENGRDKKFLHALTGNSCLPFSRTHLTPLAMPAQPAPFENRHELEAKLFEHVGQINFMHSLIVSSLNYADSLLYTRFVNLF